MKNTTLLFFVFAFSLSFAQLIDYDQNSNMGPMYQYLQGNDIYYTEQDVQYHLETHLSVPSSQSYRWLQGSGSYDDIHAGDYVCEGTFNYVTSVNALADMGDFEGRSPSVSGSDDPDDWNNCGVGNYSSCPEGNTYALWGTPKYGDPDYHDGSIKTYTDSYYRYRQIGYREGGSGSFFTDEVADVATVLAGTASLSYAKEGFTTYTNLYTFDPLSGTQPSHSGTFTVNVASGSSGPYSFNQRADVSGGTISAYNPGNDNERYWSYDSLGSGQSRYTISNIHDSQEITIIDSSDMGVIPPYITAVSLQGHTMTSGHYTLEAGEDIPATITVRIPARTSAYTYYLNFELDQAQALSPFSYSATGGLNQCDSSFIFGKLKNGGWFGNTVSYVNVTGTLHVPDALPEDGGDIQFRVHWQTCSGSVDCSGGGDSSWTDTYEIPYIPPGEELPDLMCSIEPVEIIGADETATQLEAGQGVEQWEVTITNIGGNLTLSGSSSEQLAQYLCLIGLFNAYETNSEGTSLVYDAPGHSYHILTPTNLNLTTGESVTNIFDGAVYCTEEGEIGAWNYVNIGALLSTSCGPYEFEESDWDNNVCEWSIPCVNKTGPEFPDDENCTIDPSAYAGEVGGEYDFSLTCGEGEECAGTVDWDITTGGTISGNQTDAIAEVVSDASDLQITATVDNPDGEDAVCYAQIYFGGEGSGNNCYINPTPQNGYPGSSHWFDLTCSGEGIEDNECPNADWSIHEGAAFVDLDSIQSDLFHWEGQLNQFAVNTTIVIEAEVDFPEGTETCEGEIIVPEIPCLDYV